jgi:hypothetical protein
MALALASTFVYIGKDDEEQYEEGTRICAIDIVDQILGFDVGNLYRELQ